MSIGPSRPLVLEKPAKIDIPQAARYFGARGEPDTATRTLLENARYPFWQPPRPGPSGWKPMWTACWKQGSCRAGM